jgi:hypothetical protein
MHEVVTRRRARSTSVGVRIAFCALVALGSAACRSSAPAPIADEPARRTPPNEFVAHGRLVDADGQPFVGAFECFVVQSRRTSASNHVSSGVMCRPITAESDGAFTVEWRDDAREPKLDPRGVFEFRFAPLFADGQPRFHARAYPDPLEARCASIVARFQRADDGGERPRNFVVDLGAVRFDPAQRIASVRIASADHATADVTVFRGDDSPEWEALHRIPTNTWVDFHCADLATEFQIEGVLGPNVVIPRTSIERCGALEIVPRTVHNLVVHITLAQPVAFAALLEAERYPGPADVITDGSDIDQRLLSSLRFHFFQPWIRDVEPGAHEVVFADRLNGRYVLELFGTGDLETAPALRVVEFELPHEGPLVVD